MFKLTGTSWLIALALGLTATSAFAQSTAPVASAPTGQTTATTPGATPVVKPGDRTCIRDTGSHIRPKAGECLPVAGRSYSGAELRQTGQIDTGRALQMLDPSITRGH